MRIKLIILTILLLFFGAGPSFGAAPTISNVPPTINTDTEFYIAVSFSDLSNNTVYRLRLALSTAGSSSYFGSTFNGGSWYNGTPSPINYSNFLSVTTDAGGNWSGTLQGKVESSDPNFSGSSGNYDLKVGRYTATGTSATWSNIVSVAIVASISSPNPTPSPSSDPSSFSSSTSSTSSTFTISNVPTQIDSTETFSVVVNLSLPNNPNTTFYLKGAFKKADSSNYFGLTKVSGNWIKNNKTYSDQYKITTDGSGNWSGNLEIQPDILDSGYEGSGDYIFKVGRYTDSGSLSWSNEVTIHIKAQEIILDEKDEDKILGAEEKQSSKKKTTSSKDEEYSLEKYVRVASPASVAAASVAPQTEVKGESKTNYISWIGILMAVGGIGLFTWVYLRSKGLHEAIFNQFRKRD